MKTEKAKRSEITIAGHKVEVFQLPDGEYVMSQTQAAETIGKHKMSMSRFLDSFEPETLPSKDFKCHMIATTDSPRNIQAIPLNIVTKYWLEQAFKGSLSAQALTYACVTESLERRCDAVFKIDRTEGEYENRTKTSYKQYWDNERDYLKGCHRPFEMACWRLGVSPAIMHNELTKLVTGMVAWEHRQLALVGKDSSVGLDHVPSPEQLAIIAQAKLHFASYRTGNAQKRLERAVAEAKNDIKRRRA